VYCCCDLVQSPVAFLDARTEETEETRPLLCSSNRSDIQSALSRATIQLDGFVRGSGLSVQEAAALEKEPLFCC